MKSLFKNIAIAFAMLFATTMASANNLTDSPDMSDPDKMEVIQEMQESIYNAYTMAGERDLFTTSDVVEYKDNYCEVVIVATGQGHYDVTLVVDDSKFASGSTDCDTNISNVFNSLNQLLYNFLGQLDEK